MPIVGADNVGLRQAAAQRAPGLKGAAVTNPAAVGGAGVVLGLQILDGKKPADPNVHVTPELWDNTTTRRQGSLDRGQRSRRLPPIWPLGLTIKDWTTYPKDGRQGLQGPGRVVPSHTANADAGVPAPPAPPPPTIASDPSTRI